MKHIPEIELCSSAEIRSFQESKFREQLTYIVKSSPYYRRLFAEFDIKMDSIKSLKDITEIPTTSKDDFHRHNWDFLCVPNGKIVEYTSTSGTLGSPVTIALTENDLQRLAYNECISFTCADGSDEDLYQLMLTLDRQFMAGMAYYEGIRKLGAGLIRVGPGLPAMQWEIIDRLKPTALVAVPSFLMKLIEYANQQGINLNRSSVRKAICIGESLRTADLELNTLGRRISGAWDIRLYGTYASTEMQTAFTECGHGRGGHQHPELIHVELLDENDFPVQRGEPGEITVTTLGVEGMPLLRYKTGDIAVAYQDQCPCGRNTLRLGPVMGRKQQMIKLKGTTVYPPGIFEVLNTVDVLMDYVVEVLTGELGTDELRLHLLVEREKHEETVEILRIAFQSRLKVVPSIVFIDQLELEKLQLVGKSRKVNKFIDSRQ
ncbi:MAG: AMP-binding protein [Cyclobacteriaceae bacterium]|nr:AMP-binding protein [Cyclobacteriaceae bacterium]MDH4295585.1 AMP-binding protein [Cyclobacteriaceae bacterium]MDH5249325.1 AMP-binding protein [Cyclobacteriaceae bacterium]